MSDFEIYGNSSYVSYDPVIDTDLNADANFEINQDGQGGYVISGEGGWDNWNYQYEGSWNPNSGTTLEGNINGDEWGANFTINEDGYNAEFNYDGKGWGANTTIDEDGYSAGLNYDGDGWDANFSIDGNGDFEVGVKGEFNW